MVNRTIPAVANPMDVRGPREAVVDADPVSTHGVSRLGEDGGSRILIYSHDTYGLGHFRRCLKIADETRALSPNASILLITGSPLAHQFVIPDGVDFVKLPSVVKIGSGEYRPRSLHASIHDIVSMRSRILREAALAFRPDVFLVDHAPLGLQNEALPALEALREQSSRPAMILGLRDIIDDSESVIGLWKRENIYDLIDRLFDQIVIYGQRSVFDTCHEYAFPDQLTAKTSYAGFISGVKSATGPGRATTKQRPTVLVTVGGGEDGGQIIDSFITMIRDHAAVVAFDSIVLAGPLLSKDRVDEIRLSSERLPIQVHHFAVDVAQLMADADLVVSMGGYNAVAEIMAHAKRALLVPREWPRQEQLIRAGQLTRLGYTDLLRMSELTPATLWLHVDRALSTQDAPLERMRQANVISLSGASFMAAALLQAIRRQQNRESGR